MEVLATAVRQEKEIKHIQIGKEELKFSLFAENMILYIEKSQDSTKKKITTNKINSLKLHDIKSIYEYLLHFYTLITIGKRN